MTRVSEGCANYMYPLSWVRKQKRSPKTMKDVRANVKKFFPLIIAYRTLIHIVKHNLYVKKVESCREF